MAIELDDQHVYKVDGVKRPGVSQVLDLYFPPSKFYTERGRIVGTARHLWYSFLSQGKEPDSDPAAEIAGEVAAFRMWLRDEKPEFLGGEELLFDKELGVCGKPDWYGVVRGRLATVDFKPVNKNKRTPLQTSAYRRMLDGLGVVDRYELRLDVGRYKFEQHTDDEDEDRWIALVYGWQAAQFYK
jgi:hypothetical protein